MVMVECCTTLRYENSVAASAEVKLGRRVSRQPKLLNALKRSNVERRKIGGSVNSLLCEPTPDDEERHVAYSAPDFSSCSMARDR